MNELNETIMKKYLGIVNEVSKKKLNLNDYKKSPDGDVLEYVVFREHTLGYLFKGGNTFYLGVFQGNIKKGGLDWQNGPHALYGDDRNHLRIATKKDFAAYRVRPEGHKIKN